MVRIPGYRIEEIIYKNRYSKACLALREDGSGPVLIRLPLGGKDIHRQISHLREEHQSTGGITLPGRLKYREVYLSNGTFLLEADIPGLLSLSKVFPGEGFTPGLFFNTAIDICKNLDVLHRRDFIIGCLRVDSIFIEPNSKRTIFSDYSGLLPLPVLPDSEKKAGGSISLLPYLSPEQTGCLQKPADTRSDLYSLGVLFYKMLTGILPLGGSTALEQYHALVAGSIVPPRDVNPEVPEVLSRIVLKLLERDPDCRYQSAYGLIKDLESCMKNRERLECFPLFPLAGHDVKSLPRADGSFYGRKTELEIMQSEFNSVACGRSSILLLEGEAGIGKTAFARQFVKNVQSQKVLFASGKSSQIKNEVPYHPLAEAFQHLLRWVMTTSEEDVALWREELQKKADDISVLSGIMPHLGSLLGRRLIPEVPPGIDIEERFYNAFCALTGIFTGEERRLVIFLDDLQWADRGTLSIVEAILTRYTVRNLFLIAAYRHGELQEDHPVRQMVSRIRDSGLDMRTIRLRPFTMEELELLVTGNLECGSSEAAPLTRFLADKTQGNPLFAKEVIQSMFKERLIVCMPGGGWHWDLDKLRTADFSDDLAEFLERRIRLLPVEAISLLRHASCIGNTFGAETLSRLLGRVQPEVEKDLDRCVLEGLIQREEDGTYSFIHDRIWQSVYMLIAPGQKPGLHYRLGRILWQGLEETAAAGGEAAPAALFSVVNQLSLGICEITDENEIIGAAKLFHKAGEMARQSAAFNTAVNYLRSGLGLLGERCWKDHYSIAFNINAELLDSLYLCGRYIEADSLYDSVMEEIEDLMDRSKVRTLRILYYTKKNFSSETIRIALEGLRELGCHIPQKPSFLYIGRQLAKVHMMLQKIGAGNIADLSPANSPKKKAAMDILITMGPCVYNLDSDLLLALSLKVCELSLRYGNFSNSASAYLTLAMVFIIKFKNYKLGKSLSKTALQMVEKHGSDSEKATVNFMYGAFCVPWLDHAATSMQYLLKARESGFAMSDLMYAGFAMTFEVMTLHFTGAPIYVLAECIEKNLQFVPRIKDPYYAYTLTVYRQFAKSMQGLTQGPGSFSDKSLREEDFLKSLNGIRVRERDKFDYYLMKGQVCYLLGDYGGAAALLEEAQRISKQYFGEIYLADLDYYYCLARIARRQRPGLRERISLWLRLAAKRRRLKEWAKNCPENFEHKRLLVEAETARLRDNHKRCFSLYHRAVSLAKKNGFIQDAAICCECMADYYYSRGYNDAGNKYLSDALQGYLRWGATAKVKQLKQLHPEVEARDAAEEAAAASFTETAAGRAQDLTQLVDVESIVRAAGVLSGEIVLEELLKKMMEIVLQNAGAGKGVLLLQKEGRLYVEAEIISGQGSNTVRLLNSAVIEDFPKLPKSVVYYAARTAEVVVLDNAAREGMFAGDPYIAGERTASVLCLPILHQGRTAGVLYLENSLTEGCFNPGRVETLKLLSGQIAVSIENAGLYRSLQDLNARLEDKVRERTEELAAFQKETVEALARQSRLQERNRIAREIHDTVGHTLTSVLIQIEAGKKLMKRDAGLAVEKLEQSLEQVRVGLDEVRRSIHLLGEKDSDDRVHTIEGFLKEIVKNTGITVKADISGEEKLNPAQRHVLYRALQEGITNGIRHGGSITFDFELKCLKKRSKFVLKDHGRGANEIRPGFGLTSMKDRVEKLGGSLRYSSREGEGFTVIISLPLDRTV